MAKKYLVTLDDGIAEILDETSSKLGISPTKYCRDLIMIQLNSMSLITTRVKKTK